MSNVLLRLMVLLAAVTSPMAWGEAAGKLTVLSSIRPLTLLVGDLTAGLPVEVETLLPVNADPHNWAMRVSDRQSIAAADLVVWLGPDFENFLARPLRELPATNQLQLGVLPKLRWPDESHSHDHHDHHHSGRDMHVWLNPANVIEIQKVLAEKLAEKRPQWREVLQLRLQEQNSRIVQLQADIDRRLAPHRENGFIAYHDAYGHFVAAFDLRQLNAVNQSSEQRLSAKTLHQLQAQARQAHCLMAETQGEQEQRLAKLLTLPIVVADGLALDPKLESFPDFLAAIANAFELCTSSSAD